MKETIVSRYMIRRYAAISAVMAMTPWLSGQQSNWNVGGSFGTAEFNDPANWTNGVPGSGVTARFNNNASGVITLNSDFSTGELIFANSSGELTFDFGDYTLTGSGRLGIDVTGSSNVVNFIGGKYTFTAFDIGGSSVSSQTVTISGAGTQLTASGNLIVRQSNKSLTISDGAKLVIEGTDSRFGQNPGQDNIMIITGANSAVTFADQFRVGFQSTNSVVQVLDGAKLTAPKLNIGDQKADSVQTKVIVSGSGSQLESSGNIHFRGIGGELLVENGGSASVGTLRLNATTDISNNTVHVKGSASTLSVSGNAEIGYSENTSGATLRISDGATATVDGNVQIGHQSTATNNRLWVENGASLTVKGSNGLLVYYNAELILDEGTITAEKVLISSDNRIVASGNLILGNSPTVNRVAAQGIGSGREVIIGGETKFGVLDVVGSWENAGIDLFMKLGDFSSNQAVAGDNFDQLLLSGTMTSGGTLLVDLESFVASTTVLEIRLIGWNEFSGNPDDFSISFSGFDPNISAPEFRTDGLYIVIPEPRAWMLLPGTILLLGILMRRVSKRQ